MTRKKKKPNNKRIKKRGIGLAVFSVLVIVLYINRYSYLDYFYNWYYQNQDNLHPSQTFIPTQFKYVGADISRYQEKFNWEKAQVLNQFNDTIQLKFIIAKATEGTTLVDPLYYYHRAKAKQQKDIVFGAYHFFRANKEVEAQANHFVNTAQLEEGNLLPVVDVEETNGVSPRVIREKLNLFCNLLENKYGQKPIIYSNKDFLLKIVGEGFKEYPIWVAHYGVSQVDMPNSWDWDVWQFTDRGSSFGTRHAIDLNVINGGNSALESLRISE